MPPSKRSKQPKRPRKNNRKVSPVPTMLDHRMYPHLVEAIADAAVEEHSSALAIRAVCRRFRDKADAALARHIRIERGNLTAKQRRRKHPWRGPLLVLTASGKLPLLYPSSTPPPPIPPRFPGVPPRIRKWPALAPALPYIRLMDFHTAPEYPQGQHFNTLRIDTARYMGVNDQYFSRGPPCRRVVGMQVVGVEREDWENFWPGCNQDPMDVERAVVNVFLPKHVGGLRLPRSIYIELDGGLHVETYGYRNGREALTWDEVEEENVTYVFIFRPLDMQVASYPTCPRPCPRLDAGALLAVARSILNKWTLGRKHTLVGLENVPWNRIGVPDPGIGREEWFRRMLEELVEPMLEVPKGSCSIDRVLKRVQFLSHEEYRAQVGNEEYETDLIPLEGLLDRFAVEA